MKNAGILLTLFLVTATIPVYAARVGQPAPDFSLKNSGGETRQLTNYRGKVVLINFWASWCAPCQVELPKLNALAVRNKGRLRVVTINVDNDKAQGQKSLRKLGLASSTMETLWDSKNKAVGAYSPPTMPSSYILDSKGVIRFFHEGYKPDDPALWQQEIESLLR